MHIDPFIDNKLFLLSVVILFLAIFAVDDEYFNDEE
jgi:hypothetical protein